MTIRSYSNGPRLTEEAITAGYICKIGTGAVALLDDATQATTVTVKPLGIAATDAASGAEIAVVDFGEVDVVAGTGGLTQDTSFVAEAGTGKAIAYSEAAYTDGQIVWICGRALEAIAANATGRVRFAPYQISISNP